VQCGATREDECVRRRRRGLHSLLDKSLLRRTGERFWMLETIREYARELLEGSSEGDTVRRRHADH
jgi:predicted ATPase